MRGGTANLERRSLHRLRRGGHARDASSDAATDNPPCCYVKVILPRVGPIRHAVSRRSAEASSSPGSLAPAALDAQFPADRLRETRVNWSLRLCRLHSPSPRAADDCGNPGESDPLPFPSGETGRRSRKSSGGCRRRFRRPSTRRREAPRHATERPARHRVQAFIASQHHLPSMPGRVMSQLRRALCRMVTRRRALRRDRRHHIVDHGGDRAGAARSSGLANFESRTTSSSRLISLEMS